jgi:hypothetical protein
MTLSRTLLYSMLLATLATPALASLGSDVTKVPGEAARMKAAVNVAGHENYSVHEMTTPTGTVVREYVGPAGVVFAVTWHGPFNPNLQELFGNYWQQYLQASAIYPSHNHRAQVINEPGLIVQRSGRMRAFSGRAWIPGMLPQNVSAADIK